MDNLPANSSANAERDKQRNFLYLVYGLYIVTVFTAGIAALIGLIIAYAKRDTVTDAVYATHIPLSDPHLLGHAVGLYRPADTAGGFELCG